MVFHFLLPVNFLKVTELNLTKLGPSEANRIIRNILEILYLRNYDGIGISTRFIGLILIEPNMVCVFHRQISFSLVYWLWF